MGWFGPDVEFLEPGEEPMQTRRVLNRDKRGQRGHKRGFMNNKGSWIIIGVGGIVFLLIMWYGINGVMNFGKPKAAKASQEPTVETLPTLTPTVTSIPIEAAPQATVMMAPTLPLDPAATATMVAALNRPAAQGVTENYRVLVGSITLDSSFGFCSVSNIGFNASGTPYYLYLPPSIMITSNPSDQLAEVRGVVTQSQNCLYDIIQVQSLVWFQEQATPAPIAVGQGGAISVTRTISPTATVWGTQITPMPAYSAAPTNTPAPVAAAVVSPTATTWSQTPWDPQPRSYPTTDLSGIQKQLDNLDDKISTYEQQTREAPTQTPTPTRTPTPIQANISGPVVQVGGCAASNFAVQISNDQHVYLILTGATLPASGSPTDYHALAIGLLDTVCNGQAIRASSISWYQPTPTPTATPTMTPTATWTPTFTPEPVQTTEPVTQTGIITP